MKLPSEKQIVFADLINAKTGKPLPKEKTAQAYFIYIRDNIEEYKRIQEFNRYKRRNESKKKSYHIYNTIMDDDQDADWAAAMDFSWL